MGDVSDSHEQALLDSAEFQMKKKRLLEELESALDKKTVTAQPSPLALGIEVIDETALLHSVANNLPSSRRRGGGAKNNRRTDETPLPRPKSKPKPKIGNHSYSRKELEGLRFVNMAQQRKFWKAIHAAFQTSVANEYDTLASNLLPHNKPILILCSRIFVDLKDYIGHSIMTMLSYFTLYVDNYTVDFFLRQLCRTAGVQVSIEPTNVRDSLYRASVNFVLNVCSRAPTNSTSIDINGEDAPQFLAGFAENIGLENVRAATIVSAAVAARTRSCLLQAWALEMQGKQVDAIVELSKICLLLRIFPPEESSPEMEMVSRGLEKHLKLEQRKHLMFLFGKVCGEDSQRIAREALGLMHYQNGCADQLEDNIAP
uniref:Uncharacterized protein n=1 Tax=Cajanus cajan TaxID=3821 RepID=A0A151U7U8_CAJCA|nr:hypothetical protein KK1_008124 [Cajanus cajan]